jgi:hypothetical protein
MEANEDVCEMRLNEIGRIGTNRHKKETRNSLALPETSPKFVGNEDTTTSDSQSLAAENWGNDTGRTRRLGHSL